MSLADDILNDISRLKITQGDHAGKPIVIFPWMEKFVREGVAVFDTSALSMARGNAKTTFSAAIVTCAQGRQMIVGWICEPELFFGKVIALRVRFIYQRILSSLGVRVQQQLSEEMPFGLGCGTDIELLPCRRRMMVANSAPTAATAESAMRSSERTPCAPVVLKMVWSSRRPTLTTSCRLNRRPNDFGINRIGKAFVVPAMRSKLHPRIEWKVPPMRLGVKL